MNSIYKEKKIRVAVIGATGSVGSSVMSVCRSHKDKIEVYGLAAFNNSKKLNDLAAEFKPKLLFNYSEHGLNGLYALAEDENIDNIIFASSGTAAIPALQRAAKLNKNISLANKESIVVAGEWVMPLITREDQLRPLDSEHNAIWQCLHGEKLNLNIIKSIYLTASGGPFRKFTREELERVTPEMALKHPVWDMGAKITIDSATLVNKGIELIEAMYLFKLRPEQVNALISPGSFIHGLIEFTDGSVKMLAAEPDMRLPAENCIFWPERYFPASDFKAPDFINKNIIFEEPDVNRFPAMRLARYAMINKGVYPALLVGADEAAVNRFLNGGIKFNDIALIIEKVFEACSMSAPKSLDEALYILDWARNEASRIKLN